MKTFISKLKEAELFCSIDLHFAEFISRHTRSCNTVLASALLSQAVQQGHICFSLSDLTEKERKSLVKSGIEVPDTQKWIAELKADTKVVGGAYDLSGAGVRPLILDADDLFFQKYFSYEENIRKNISKLTAPLISNQEEETFIKNKLNDTRIFEESSGTLNWQRVAAFLAIKNRFSVISGGPGTGKTTTLAKILCILYELDPHLKIALAAPTGKAAARMGEAVKEIKKKLIDEIPEMEETVQKIPEDSGSTLHRLLGTRLYSESFKHNRDNRLKHDLVIVDECSMISVPLMSKLLEALRDDARLILLGDKDQLASVEAGRCFGDICESSAVNAFSRNFVDDYKHITGIELPVIHNAARSTVQLEKSHRFPENSIVGRISKLINTGNELSAQAALDLAKKGLPPENSEGNLSVTWHTTANQRSLINELTPIVKLFYKPLIEAESPLKALEALETIRVLGCIKDGVFGVMNLNIQIEKILVREKMIQQDDVFYENRPIMILKNDYSLNLFNGNMGIFRKDVNGNRRAWFPGAKKGELRSFAPSLLPEHETAYAITVHKAQGSEFDTVVLVLPVSDSQVLTRELMYTGITRTKRSVIILGTESIFLQAISRQVARKSGLKKKMELKNPEP